MSHLKCGYLVILIIVHILLFILQVGIFNLLKYIIYGYVHTVRVWVNHIFTFGDMISMTTS